MKRLLPWIVSLILAFGMVGCDGKDAVTNQEYSSAIELQASHYLAELNLTEEERALIDQIDHSIESTFEGVTTQALLQEVTEEDNTTILSIEDRGEAYHSYGVLFALNAYTNLAQYYFLKAVENQPDNALYLSEAAAVIAAGEKDLQKAAPFIEAAEALDPDDAAAQMTLASYYDLYGDGEKALEHYQKAADLDKENPLLRQLFFDALSIYHGLDESLYQLRVDTMRYCEDTFTQTAALDPDYKSALAFLDAKTQELIPPLQKISDIVSTYTGEHLSNVYTVWEDNLFSFFQQWDDEIAALQNRVDEEMEQDTILLQQCLSACNDTGCVCGCFNAWLIELSDYAIDPLYAETSEILSRQLPRAFTKMDEYEYFVLSYILKNIAYDDIASITALIRFLYANYQISCTTSAMDYFNTIYPYHSLYELADSFGTILSSCPPKSYPSPSEEEQKLLKKEAMEKIGGDPLADALLSTKFKVCLPGGLVSLCMGIDHGVFELEASSGPISLSARREIQSGRALGGSIGIGKGVGIEPLTGIDVGAKVQLDSEGGVKSVSLDTEVKALNGMATLKKGKVFLYKSSR